MSRPGWEDVLPSPSFGGSLHEAWFTTFDPPDSGLLVEHVLPSLLGASHSLSQDLKERSLFFGELGSALEALRGRLTVISSPPHADRKEAQYPWLWRYVSHFTVGAQARAVQHAKLWAFHWKAENEEWLELRVSSTNLTESAFKDQLQAGWEVKLPLAGRVTDRTRRTWGELIPFIDALADSAGEIAAARLQRLKTLLARVECPGGVTFIASVPGKKSAARQLKPFDVSEIHVMAPTVGDWDWRELSAWGADVGIGLDKVHLKWIPANHPWVASHGWAMSRKAKAALEDAGVKMESISNGSRLSEQHQDADSRWSHAKLYLLRSRAKRRLLVTSANWSRSAWGAGKETPRNFELGVIFESAWTDLETIGEPFDPPRTAPFCLNREDETPFSTLQWAQALWNGERIEFHLRSTDSSMPVTVAVSFAGGTEKEHRLSGGTLEMRWTDTECAPLSARFTQGVDVLDVNVIDIRPPAEFAKTPLPEVDPADAAALREAFLLRRYGGPAVDPESVFGARGPRKPSVAGGPAADFAVQAWLDARAAFNVLDQWRVALAQVAGDRELTAAVRQDGEELRTLYGRGDTPSCRLVAEELCWRLNEIA